MAHVITESVYCGMNSGRTAVHPSNIFFHCFAFLEVDIMGGGLTLEVQTLYKFVKKLFKGHFSYLYNIWSLTSPIVARTGAHKEPTRQLLSSWVVKYWNLVPEDLIKNYWTNCGYTPEDELGVTI